MDNKIDPSKTNSIPSNTDTILTHILQLESQKMSEANQISENHLLATANTNKLLENNIEATARLIETTTNIIPEIQKNTEAISTLLLQQGGGNKITDILEKITKKIDEPTNLIVKLEII